MNLASFIFNVLRKNYVYENDILVITASKGGTSMIPTAHEDDTIQRRGTFQREKKADYTLLESDCTWNFLENLTNHNCVLLH